MSPHRILIVEDELIISKEISRRLQTLGYEPAGRAITGEQALAMTEVQRPDLILMDIRLIGEMDGIQTAIEILRRFRTPVIFLTAYSEDETLDRAKLAEPYGYLTKPLDDRDLRSTIEMALHKHKVEEEVRRLSRLYDVLSQVNQTIVRVESHEELFPAVCRLLVDRGEIDLAWVSRLEPCQSRMDIVAHYGEQGELLKEVRFHEEPRKWDTVHDLIREGRPFVCNEIRTGECMYPLELPQGGLRIESFGSFPLTFQREVWGSLNVCVSGPGFFQDREIRLFEEVAMDVSFALDRIESETRRKHAEETALRQNRVLEGINRIFRETLSSSTEEHLGVACLSVAEEVTGSRFGFLSKTNTKGHLLDIAVSKNGKEECSISGPAGHNLLPETLEPRGIFGRVVKDGKAFFSNDPGKHPDSTGLPPGHPPLETFLGAPLKQDTRTVGLIALGNRKGGYSSIELEALEALTPAVVEAFNKKSAETALAQSRAEFRAIFNSISDAIIFTNTNREILMVNPAFTAMFGYEAEEVRGRTTEFLHVNSSAHEEEGQKLYLPGKVTDEALFEATYRRKDGSLFPAESLGVHVKDAKGRVIGLLGVHRDITERKRIEDALAQSEEHFRTVVEGSPDAIFVQTQGYFAYLNRAALEVFGATSRQQLLGKPVMERFHPDYHAVVRERIRLLNEEKKAASRFEQKYLRIDGTPVDVEVQAVPLRYRNCDGAAVFVRDITARKQAEEALRESERRYRMVADYNYDWEYWIKPDGTLMYVSPSCQRITGYSAEDFIRNPALVQSICHPDDQEWINAHMSVSNEQGPEMCQKDYRIITQGGEVRWISHYCRPIWAEDGTHLGRRASNRDISDRVTAREEKERLESQLRHAQKLEAIGTLAGGIAHDFNNILSPIIGYTEMAMDSIAESSPVRWDLNQVLTAARRATELVKQILSFSRLGEDQLMKPVDVSLIVKEALKLLRASLPSTIEITQNIHKVTILADATQIHQVAVNLCTNAAHAMEDTGILDVSLVEVQLSAQDLVDFSIADLRPGKHLKLSVKDTGVGMSSETMQRVFDPYFTTKEVGKGTGLGLAVVRGIVKRHGGEILVSSEIGKGSVFDVFIPVVESELQREGITSQTLPKGTERILLVDDEPAIATMAARLLERLGYKVTAKTSPKEALDLFRSQPDQFDLIITDYTMPQIVGTQLADECRQIRAEIPVIICTGYSERLKREEPGQTGAGTVAMKPLDRKQLAVLVREVLDKTTS